MFVATQPSRTLLACRVCRIVTAWLPPLVMLQELCVSGAGHPSFSPLCDFSLAATMFAGLFTVERKCGPMAFPADLLLR